MQTREFSALDPPLRSCESVILTFGAPSSHSMTEVRSTLPTGVAVGVGVAVDIGVGVGIEDVGQGLIESKSGACPSGQVSVTVPEADVE